eukprot:scaffold10110_cov69-Phaeocystis_antarctica.AAC.19
MPRNQSQLRSASPTLRGSESQGRPAAPRKPEGVALLLGRCALTGPPAVVPFPASSRVSCGQYVLQRGSRWRDGPGSAVLCGHADRHLRRSWDLGLSRP